MKTCIFIICILVCSNTLYSQSETIEGTYQLDFNGTNADLQRTLTLNGDGTFLFHNYENHEAGIPPEKNIYGKGMWTFKNNVIYFYTSSSDIDKKYTLDFNNSKARFIIKSPRDKTNRIVKTSIRFFESDIFWIKGMRLIQI